MRKADLKKFNIRDLFYKEKLVIILSIVLAFIIWVVISSNETESRPTTISNIPISIELSSAAISDGLKVFTGNSLTAEVSVIGNRIIVGRLSKSDIRVVAQQASYITSPGNYTLELTAKKASNLTGYEFDSGVTPRFITVMVDRYKEVEFDVEDGIKYKSDPKYFAGSTILSSPKVKVSGPESEVSKIKRVVVEAEVSEVLSKNKNLMAPLVMYDSYGDVISNENIVLSVDYEEVTIPILLRKNLSVTPVFKNNPSSLNIPNNRVKVSPSNLEIAAPEKIFDSMKFVKLVPLDFSKVSLENTKFSLDLDLPSECKSISNIYNVELNVDLTGYLKSSKTLSKFEFVNVPEGKQPSIVTKEISVVVIGLKDELDAISGNDVVGEIDLSEKANFTGSTEIPVNVKVKNRSTCWVYGEYKANINISDKS